MTSRLTILLTNDDGYDSTGIKRLYDALSARHDVIVVAPSAEQSGVGHAFTFNKPLRFAQLPQSVAMPGYMIAGTPSDCVKFAVSHLLKRRPDAVVSGMNSGENSGISGFYSGTVAAAREGAFWRIPSFAFSLMSIENDEVFIPYFRTALGIFETIMANPVATDQCHVYYNVNFPACAPDKCKGIKITRQSLAFFDDRYKRISVENAPDEFVIYGEKTAVESSDEYDSRALLSLYTTITPLCYDATAMGALPKLKSLIIQ
jgi:5'-nucleotidase